VSIDCSIDTNPVRG